MDTLSSGLRELDLSYCNLSMVPDGIGLLHRLANLNLSGNNFSSLPANIGLLSNLRMLCLNDCKRLQSLPKLSVVNEDTLYGFQMRFSYIISVKRVDVSKFHATSNNTCPMVSCLNCPKVAGNESSGHLAERILNNYLQLRTRCWIIPEAVFEIVGAGSEIPLGFKLLRSDESLNLQGPWIGVAICAVVALHHIDAAMETKYVVTALIHVGEKHWSIPVPVNLLAAGLENQLVFYWTRAGDLQRTLDSSQENDFKFSFSVEPRDCMLQVTKFGVRSIHEEDIMKLKKLQDSTTSLEHVLYKDTLFLPSELLSCMSLCGGLTLHYSCDSSINLDFTRSIAFICDYGKQQYTLDDMHEVVKRFIEINQEVLSECKEEWSQRKIYPLVYDYYPIIHGTSELYNEFLRLLKDAFDRWLSVKLALEQIMAKKRTNNDYSYREMLEQLIDLEAVEGIRYCYNLRTSFAFICRQTVAFLRHLNIMIHDIEICQSMIKLVKASSMTIACILSILATFMCTDEQLQEMKEAGSLFVWLNVINVFSNNRGEWFGAMGSYGREMRIWDFVVIAVVVHELKMKLIQSASFTRQNEEEMIIAVNKLEKMMDKISVTIEDMCWHARLYSIDIREAGIALNQFTVDSNLQLSVTGIRSMPIIEEQYENSVSEAMTVLRQAALSLTLSDLQGYIRACEEEADVSSLLPFHSTIHDNTRSMIKVVCDPNLTGNSLDGIHKVITHLCAINQEGFMVLSEFKDEWRHHPPLFHLVNDYQKICLQTSQLYDFLRLLKGQHDSRLSVILRWKEIMVNSGKCDNYQIYEEDMIDGRFTPSGDFKKSLAYICKQTAAFTRQFKQEIEELKSVKILAKVSSGLIAGIFSVMAANMVDLRFFQLMKETLCTSVWLHLVPSFSWNSHLGKHVSLVIKEFSDIDYLLWEVKVITEDPTLVGKEVVMDVIDTAVKKMDELSVTIEEMSRHALKCTDDVIKAGKSLELISHNNMLPIKRKH